MNLVQTLINKIKNLDKKVVKIMHIGFVFSFILCLISALSLFTYEVFYSVPTLFYSGISLFRTGLMFACMSFACGIGFDTIRKERI